MTISGPWHQPIGGDMLGNHFTWKYYATDVIPFFNINIFLLIVSTLVYVILYMSVKQWILLSECQFSSLCTHFHHHTN